MQSFVIVSLGVVKPITGPWPVAYPAKELCSRCGLCDTAVGVPSVASATADALPAFVSTCLKMKHMLQALSASIGRPINGVRGDAACAEALESLRDIGLTVQLESVAFDADSLVK